MKVWKKLQIGMFTMLMMLAGMLLYGSDVRAAVSGDYEYEENEEGVTITKYNGSGGDVVIPSEIDGKKVTEVGNYSIGRPGSSKLLVGAFDGCLALTGVSIPDSVTKIGEAAFKGCNSLSSLEIPASVASIGERAFYGCNGLEDIKVDAANKVYDSRKNCKAVIETKSNELFIGCRNTVIPTDVASIRHEAFRGLSALEEIKIPASVTAIGNYAFYGCSGLTTLENSSKVKSIENSVFEGCSSLAEIKIPASVTSIGNMAFRGCSSLTKIEIPASVTSIGHEVFIGCNGLTDIKVQAGNAVYDSRNNCRAVIETRTDELIIGCKNTVIPSDVESIGNEAFYGCSGLTEIVIPSSVESIGDGAFSYCSGLADIKVKAGNEEYDSRDNCNAVIETDSDELVIGCKNTVIPSDVESIGDSAFEGCSGLASIEIPSSVTSIGSHAFFNCSSLASIEIPSSVTNIDWWAFGYYSDEDKNTGKVPGFTIYGVSGTAAEDYASEEGFVFQPISADNFKISLSKATVKLRKESYTYDGTPKTPSVIVRLKNKLLRLNRDYTVSYRNNTNAGRAEVIITGKGKYTGSTSAYFTIKKIASQEVPDSSITCKKTVYKVTYGAKPFKINASSKEKLAFTSSSQKVAVVDKKSGKVTIKGTGVATITIKAGKTSVKVAVKVNPKKQAVKSVKATKGRKLAITWAKDKRASGYQVQVSTDKNFKKDVKSKNVSKISYTFTKLKLGKKYYVRIRSYKKSGKETLYGAWSSMKRSASVKK